MATIRRITIIRLYLPTRRAPARAPRNLERRAPTAVRGPGQRGIIYGGSPARWGELRAGEIIQGPVMRAGEVKMSFVGVLHYDALVLAMPGFVVKR